MAISLSDFTRFQQLTSVRLSTIETANLDGAYFNGPTNNGVDATLTNAGSLAILTIDSSNPNNDDSVLLIGQTNKATNGIYTVVERGSVTTPWVLKRRSDFQCIEQIRAGYYVTVEDGLTNAGSVYTVVLPLPAALGVNDLLFRSADQDSQPVNSILARTISMLGGSATFSLALTGVTSSSVAVANIESSANAVSIQKVTPGSNEITFLCSGDPGVGFMNIIVFKASQ